MRPRRRRRHQRPAHSLWEVLLVLALLGALAGLAAPSLRLVTQPEVGLDAATRPLVALLERARLTALERGTTVDVRLDPASGRAWIFAVDADSLRLTAVSSFTRMSTVAVASDGVRPRFVFAATGTATGTAIVVRGVEGVRRIGVDPWTGGVYVASR